MKARWNVVDTLPLEERTIARVRAMGTVAALLALATASTGGRAGS
jgi:hypothetical protein